MKITFSILIVALLIALTVIFSGKWSESSALPSVVQGLCEGNSESEFVADDGYRVTFRGKARSAQKCEGGIWKVREGAVTEGGTFYLDKEGEFIDMCQPLFRRSVCQKYEDLSCDEKNYCG